MRHSLLTATLIGLAAFTLASACKRPGSGSALLNEGPGSTSFPNNERFSYHGIAVDEAGTVLKMPSAPDAPAPTPGAPGAYMTRCDAEGVPLPPAWGDEAWKLVGDLNPKKLFAGEGKAQLWTYTNDRGTCAALPRFKDDGTTVNLFAVICASSEGKTCFFDNADPADGATRVAVPKGYRIADGAGADTLRENCTSCHRGDNPWVATPGEPTAKLPKYDLVPIGPAAWENPKGDGAIADCEGCHSLPRLSSPYCGVARAMFRQGVMPPRGKTEGQAELAQACDAI